MQPNNNTNGNSKLPSDVIVLVESSSLIGVCYDLILENYLKPLIQHFYGTSMIDELGLIKDLSGVLFSAITYKGLTSLPSSICTHLQPTSHVKLFYDRLENLLESQCLEDQCHIAEGFALALDIFEDLENRRRGNKSERVISNRHLILVACQSAYEDVPIFESNNYRGLKFDEILQSLQKLQVNLTIISPNYRPDFIRLYEKVNSVDDASQGEFKLEKFGNFSFLVLLHSSIKLIDYEAQKQQLLQQQLMQQQQQLAAQKQAEILAQQQQQQVQTQTQPQPQTQENINGIKIEAQTNQNPNIYPPPAAGVAAAPVAPPQQTPPQQYQQAAPAPPPKVTIAQAQTQPELAFNQQQAQAQQVNKILAVNPVQAPQPQPSSSQQPMVAPNVPQQQQQQQIAQQHPLPPPPQMQPQLPTATPIRPATGMIGQQPQQQPPQQQQAIINNLRMPNPQMMQTMPPQTVQQTAIAPQQQQQHYMQMNPSTPQQQQQQYTQQQQQQPLQPPPQQQQQQQQQAAAAVTGNFNYNHKVQIWEGQIEWTEKDRANPNIKSMHTAPAIMYSFVSAAGIIDPATGQYASEVSVAAAQTWPSKISLQMMSKQILDILMPICGPPVRNLILHTDNQDVKNSLNSVGGALINFASLSTSLDVKVMLVICQNNELICKIPADQNKFMNALKQIIAKQKIQQQQRMQQQPQQQQQPPQQQQMMQPPQMGMNPVLGGGAAGPGGMIQGMAPQQAPTQIIMQPNMQAPNANNWINVPQQQQQQQPQPQQQPMYMMPHQQGQQPPKNFNFGGGGAGQY